MMEADHIGTVDAALGIVKIEHLRVNVVPELLDIERLSSLGRGGAVYGEIILGDGAAFCPSTSVWPGSETRVNSGKDSQLSEEPCCLVCEPVSHPCLDHLGRNLTGRQGRGTGVLGLPLGAILWPHVRAVRTQRGEHFWHPAPVLQHQAGHLDEVGREIGPVEAKVLGP